MPKTIDFYFDLSSPYSYLGSTQIEALAARYDAEVVWKPVVLGAVFKAAGNTIPSASASKARWMLGDLHRWATRYGVPFRFCSRFPFSAIKAERMILAAEAPFGARSGSKAAKLGRALFDAAWAEDRDLSSAEELSAIAAGVGLDGAALLAATETAPVKDALRALTDEALGRGMFGAPAFFLDGQLFWGNDRLDFLEAALRA